MADRRDDKTLRLSITLPGSASLGAYQAGAVAALAVVINSLRSRGTSVHVDAVGGSSAGAFVAVLVSHCLLTGRDAPRLLSETWVEEVDIELLRSGGSDAPLATDDLRNKLESFLGDTEGHPYRVHEPLPTPIRIHVGLTGLMGFTVPIDTGPSRLSGLSYVDWVEYVLQPGHDDQALLEPADTSIIDAVLTSATHPAAFKPRLLDRRADREAYRERGVDNLPDHARLWYTDGGLIESRPVGRILEAARRQSRASPGRAGRRLHLVIDPRSSGPSAEGKWSDPDCDHSWLDGLRRAASIVPTQALHDDLRGVADVNDRLRRLDDLSDELADRLQLPASAHDQRQRLRAELAQLGGLDRKEIVDIDMISPLLLTEGDDDGVNDLLAGDFIGAFGGFLETSIRRSDFAVGWESSRRWAERALPSLIGTDGACGDEILAELEDARPEQLGTAILDDDGVAQLTGAGRWQLLLLAGQFGRVILRSAIPSPLDAIRRRR